MAAKISKIKQIKPNSFYVLSITTFVPATLTIYLESTVYTANEIRKNSNRKAKPFMTFVK